MGGLRVCQRLRRNCRQRRRRGSEKSRRHRGRASDLCQTDIIFGTSWAPDNTILFGQPTGIMRVSANGGTPELVVRASDGEQVYGPQLLPGGDSVLFSVTTDTEPGTNRWDRGQVVVQSLSSGERTVVVQGGSDARYLATGHLVYASRDALFGVAFDAGRPTATAGAVPLVQGIQRPVSAVSVAGVNYAVSDQGTLVYVPATEVSRSLVWMNRNGTPPLGPSDRLPQGRTTPPASPRTGVACW